MYRTAFQGSANTEWSKKFTPRNKSHLVSAPCSADIVWDHTLTPLNCRQKCVAKFGRIIKNLELLCCVDFCTPPLCAQCAMNFPKQMNELERQHVALTQSHDKTTSR